MSNMTLEDFDKFLESCKQAKSSKMTRFDVYDFCIIMPKKIDASNWLAVVVVIDAHLFDRKPHVFAFASNEQYPSFGKSTYDEAWKDKLVEVPDAFAKQISNNALFMKALRLRLHQHDKNGYRSDEIDKVVDDILKNGIDNKFNNKIVQLKSAQRASKDAIKKAQSLKADAKAFIKMLDVDQEWQYSSEYVRGFGAPAHDDDYASSGKCSFKDIAMSICKSIDDVKKLAIAPIGTKLKHIADNIRTVYIRTK